MVGNCFYYQTPPAEDHLFVVLAPSREHADAFVCVNITARREGSDTTCELLRGEYQELTEPVSIPLYGFARELPLALISRLMREQQLPKIGDELLLRIQRAAALETSRMKKQYRRAVREYLNPPDNRGALP
jgi:hypothetical protein